MIKTPGFDLKVLNMLFRKRNDKKDFKGFSIQSIVNDENFGNYFKFRDNLSKVEIVMR